MQHHGKLTSENNTVIVPFLIRQRGPITIPIYFLVIRSNKKKARHDFDNPSTKPIKNNKLRTRPQPNFTKPQSHTILSAKLSLNVSVIEKIKSWSLGSVCERTFPAIRSHPSDYTSKTTRVKNLRTSPVLI